MVKQRKVLLLILHTPGELTTVPALHVQCLNQPRNRPLTEQWRLSSFEMGRPLGKGQFGRVYLVRTKTRPAFILALKTIYKSEVISAKLEVQVRREIEIQSNLRSALCILAPFGILLTRLPGIPTCSGSMAISTTRNAYFLCSSMLPMASCTGNWPSVAALVRSEAVV